MHKSHSVQQNFIIFVESNKVESLDTSNFNEDDLETFKTGDAMDARVMRKELKDPYMKHGPEDDLVEKDADSSDEEEAGAEDGKDERIFGKTIQGMEDSDGEESGATAEELDSDPDCPVSRLPDTSNIRVLTFSFY